MSKKLGTDKSYKRPKVTLTDSLTKEEIEEMLIGYEKVDDIMDVPIDTHLRYFSPDENGVMRFKTGGFLKDKSNGQTYVYLTNRKYNWCVQTKDAIFFRKLSHQEELEAIHAMYKRQLDEKDVIINKLKKFIRIKLAENPDLNTTSVKPKTKTTTSKSAAKPTATKSTATKSTAKKPTKTVKKRQ